MSSDESAKGTDERVIFVAGELDFHTAPDLRKEILSLLNEGVDRLVLDVGQLDFIDSSGLSVIIAGFKRFNEQGGELILRSLTDRTRRVFEVSGLNNVLSFE